MRDFLNPRKPGGVRWWHIHVSLGVFILGIVIAYLLGAFTGVKFNERYFQTHYPRNELPVPPPIAAPLPGAPRPLATAAYIRGGFAAPVVDQGYTNQCESWSFCEAYTYLYNARRHDDAAKHHRRAPASVRFACTFLYNVLERGNDGPTEPSKYPPLLRDYGLPYWRLYPYAPNAEVWPYAGSVYSAARPHRYAANLQMLGNAFGSGMGLVNRMKTAIARSRLMVVTAIPIFPSSLDAANEHAGHVDLPAPGDTYSGGHAFVIRGYSDRHCYQHVCGWFWAQNTYGTHYALNGYMWVSYRLIATWGYATYVLHLNPRVAPGGRVPPRGANPAAPLHPAPAPPPSPTHPPTLGGTSWYVHGVRLTTGQDVSALLNYWGDRYHVWPIGLAATLGVESALDPNAERWAGGLDNSCGLAQQIIVNVTAETGIGDARAACNWEEAPANSIYLEAKLYAAYFAYQHNCVTWPLAYEMYNAGAGYSCAYYSYPASDVAAHEQVFLGWYDYALAHWQGGSPPAPPKPKTRPFDLKLWDRYWAAHRGHVAQVWPWRKVHGKISLIMAARLWLAHGPKRTGGILGPERYDVRARVMREDYQGWTCWWWPGKPRYAPIWRKHRWVR